MEIDIITGPHTKEVILEGLRQALQARVASIWGNVSLAGEPFHEQRFADGLRISVDFYEQAWNAINKTVK